MSATVSITHQKIAAASIVTLLATAGVDYLTGYEFGFTAAYLIPVSLCAWHFGMGSVLLMSVASGVAAWLVDKLGGHPYSHALFHYWNSFTCFVISLITGFVLFRLRRTLAERKKINDSLAEKLQELRRSTEDIRNLQNGLQVMCASAKEIKVGDRWMTPDEFLSSHLHMRVTNGMSPEAARNFEEKIAQAAQARNGQTRATR